MSLASFTFPPDGGKSTVAFMTADSVLITADHYLTGDSLPYIILLHEQESSRGEFNDIVDRFQKMNFNCLSVDLRNGGNASFVGNETVKYCRSMGISSSTRGVEADISASIDYARSQFGTDVILIGAGANGSMALKVGMDNPVVKGVIALSPGEYFLPFLDIEKSISGMQKPVLVTSSRLEYPYAVRLVSGIDENYKKVYAPSDAGERGTKALLPDNPSNGDYWLNILLFFKDLH